MSAAAKPDRTDRVTAAELSATKRDHYRRLKQLLLGLAWMSFVALLGANVTERPLPALYAVIVFLLLSLGCGVLIAFWSVGWLTRGQARGGHYNIAFLFLAMLVLGVFLGFVRWITDVIVWNAPGGPMNEPQPGSTFLAVAIATFFMLLLSLLPILGLLDSTMWILVWLVRRPLVGHLLARWRRRP